MNAKTSKSVEPPKAAPVAAARAQAVSAALQAGPVTVVDLGAGAVSAAVVRRAGDADGGASKRPALELLGLAVGRSRGVDGAGVTDVEAAAEACRAAILEAQRRAGASGPAALLALSAAHPRSHLLSSEVAIGKEVAGPADAAAAVQACAPPAEAEGRVLLHATPLRWRIDGAAAVRNPVGQAGTRLRMDLHALSVAAGAARTLAICAHRAGATALGAVATPYAAALGAVSEEERRDGVACLDLGAERTGLCLFTEGRLTFCDELPVGGAAATQAVARAFGLPILEAERLKRAGPGVAPGEGDAKKTVALSDGSPGPTRAEVTKTLRAEAERVLALAHDRLSQAGFGFLPGGRVVLVGGGASSPGLAALAADMFARPARVGAPAPDGVSIPEAVALGPAQAAVIGLAAWILEPPEPPWPPRAEPAEKSAAGGLWGWVRDSW